MRSNSIRSIRRTELSGAAFEAVILYGLRKTTLEKVSSSSSKIQTTPGRHKCGKRWDTTQMCTHMFVTNASWTKT